MKVTFNNGYYIVKTETRESHYRADVIKGSKEATEEQIKHLQRALKDLEAIERYQTQEVLYPYDH